MTRCSGCTGILGGVSLLGVIAAACGDTAGVWPANGITVSVIAAPAGTQSAAEVRHGLKGVPLVDLCYLGGWKDPQTILKCYQRPDERTVREVLANRGRRAAAGE